MRFRQRTKVLLPQPEGPITAGITFCSMPRAASLIAEVLALERKMRAVANGDALDLEDVLCGAWPGLFALGDVDRPHRRHRNRLTHLLLLGHRIMLRRLRASASLASRLVTSTNTISTSAVAQARS